METNSQHKIDLLVQIKEAYGRVLYTYTCHNKIIGRLERKNTYFKYLQIVLSAISTGGFIGAVINDEYLFTVVGGIFSTVLLMINLFFKDFSLNDEIEAHRKASDELWILREKYISLMTDFNVLDTEEIRAMRDRLQEETHKIYSDSPKTDGKSYAEAQKALKTEEEQFFTNQELNQILPIHLRTSEDLDIDSQQ